MTKHPTITVCKASIPVLLVSYGASLHAGESSIEVNSIETDTSNTSSRLKPRTDVDHTPRFVTVANAGEQLNQDHYRDGKINLNIVGFGQLQNILDSYAERGCAHEVQTSCRWKVLKLERTGRGHNGEQFSGVSAVLPPKVADTQTIAKPDVAKPIKVALHVSRPPATHDKENEPRSATYQPRSIVSAVEQRVSTSEWVQSFNAPPPDNTTKTTTELVTPVVLDLPRQSEVRLLVNGHEETAEILDAGHNTLDTSSLPEGSYPIRIQVSNDVEGQRVIHQMYGRQNLGVQQPTTSYGVFRQVPLHRHQIAAKTTREDDIALETTVFTSLGSTSTITANTSKTASDVAQTADMVLARRGNQYQLALDGTISSHSALGMILKAAYHGKRVSLFFQDIGFVPAREMTGDPELARFLGVNEHLTMLRPVWYQGEFALPLIPVRRQDPINGLVESQTHFATRLARAVDADPNRKPSMHYRLIDMQDLDEIQLHAKFQAQTNAATLIHHVSRSDLEIETPFFNLA